MNKFIAKYNEFTSSESIEDFIESFRLLTNLMKSKSIRLNEEIDWQEHINKRHEEMLKELEEKTQNKYKELEKKFPELLKIKEEALKHEAETFEKMGSERAEKFKKFEKELTDCQGFKAAMEVLSKFVKDVGVLKSFKMLKSILALMLKLSDCEKRASKIVPKGEKYFMPVVGPIIGGESRESDDIINKIKNAISVKNLMKVITGKTDELELEYMKKDGKEASGELKEVEIKDDGSIKLTIDNDAVGEIKKDITEISPDAGKGDDEDDVQKKINDFVKSKPEKKSTILQFVNFISDDKNKDKIVELDKLIVTGGK